MKVVIPAQAGIQKNGQDTGFRRYDGRTFIGKPESRFFQGFWTPAFAGVTVLASFEIVTWRLWSLSRRKPDPPCPAARHLFVRRTLPQDRHSGFSFHQGRNAPVAHCQSPHLTQSSILLNQAQSCSLLDQPIFWMLATADRGWYCDQHESDRKVSVHHLAYPLTAKLPKNKVVVC
jgi:hypothetical protein